jgi:hypothetical protein
MTDTEVAQDDDGWIAMDGDKVTCCGCDHLSVVSADGEEAYVDNDGNCECEWCTS